MPWDTSTPWLGVLTQSSSGRSLQDGLSLLAGLRAYLLRLRGAAVSTRSEASSVVLVTHLPP